MIEYFALSIIRAINAKLPSEYDTECFLKPDVDAQNAIQFTHSDGVIYWQVYTDLKTNAVMVKEIYLTHDLEVEHEQVNCYDTVNGAIITIAQHIRLIKGI